MKKNTLKPVAMALGSSVVLALSAAAGAAENPFQMVEFGTAITVADAKAKAPAAAPNAVDMQGNPVAVKAETGFTYGGDQTAKYSGGKLATGKKDPAVCGTFGGASCSVAHLQK